MVECLDKFCQRSPNFGFLIVFRHYLGNAEKQNASNTKPAQIFFIRFIV